MDQYEAPSIVELGSVDDLTCGTGNQHRWDSAYPGFFGILGIPLGTGGEYSS
ncbi:MAG: lasso RiPP family leader peptide-containing protein [Ilumatobacter sp.]|nr:lasso RiPP family leader peptide-containing protein [Ilumatobacter sp.]